jgi:hypothetical protein
MGKKVEYMAIEKLEKMAAARKFNNVMTTEEFMSLYNSKPFRVALHEMINAQARGEELREDMLQEAWLSISLLPNGLKQEAYLSCGARAAERLRKKEQRHADMFREDWVIKKELDRQRKRITRAGKRAKIILKRRPK